jgi:methylphosphotriester-DNA--protein-cysteine methyltransferase
MLEVTTYCNSYFQEETKKEWAKPEEDEIESQFKDHRINASVNLRKRRAFTFVTPGKYIKEANQQRLQEKMKRLQEKINEKTRETGIQQATALLAPRSRQEWEMHVPESEWYEIINLTPHWRISVL